jgi:hypothetical protein
VVLKYYVRRPVREIRFVAKRKWRSRNPNLFLRLIDIAINPTLPPLRLRGGEEELSPLRGEGRVREDQENLDQVTRHQRQI